jgi:hypothetical protein
MKKYQNEGVIDRGARLLISELFILGAYFWTGGILSVVLYIIGIIALVTAVTGFCGLYKVIGISTLAKEQKETPNYVKVIFVLLFLIIAIAGSYASNFFTKKIFLDYYSRMNNYYKQTLFYTGQDKRDEAVSNYDKLVTEYAVFYKKYSTYHPYVFKSDSKFNADLKEVSDTITSLKENVYSGDLKQTHTNFESVRPVFQDILKRNGFSLLAVSLVDFHDAMEKIITAADAKDTTQLLSVYPEVDLKLKEVEAIVSDEEIQTIRTKLEEVVSLAKEGKTELLSSKAAELKSAFVKVYLKRG